ncbi:MAG TPA: hypothetical protein VHR97_00530 [Candidatus Baltobacteraceae bacterium]|jgi:hypothetical protein|nr:hypothetical protein [Candidatus Baltobacteraceae bacterium]
MPQTSAIGQHAARGKSWMLPEASSEDLIYATGGCGGTCVLSYPQGKVVGTLDTLGAAVCSDAQGSVFILHFGSAIEYAHGGTTPIATLSLTGAGSGCSVDPTSNNLAVVFGNGRLAVFANESGSPTMYSTGLSTGYCGYDNAGNLFVSGYNGGAGAIAELPYGQQAFNILSVSGTLGSPGQMQWDGSHMTYENRTRGVADISVSQLSISGSVASVIGTTSLNGGNIRYAWQSWIYKGNLLLPYGRKDEKVNKLGLWRYPNGGNPKRAFKLADSGNWSFYGVTVSVAPSR